MGRGCTTPDVMKAIYYLSEQQYETGAGRAGDRRASDAEVGFV